MATKNSALIWAFDLGTVTGFAVGNTAAKFPPLSRSVTLDPKKIGNGTAGANLIRFFQQEAKIARPALVMVERAIAAAARASMGMSEVSNEVTAGLHYILKALCVLYGIPRVDATAQTIRKHFVGVGNLGSREATNRAVVSRCQVLGYMPRTVVDWDRANALAAWDWAKAHVAHTSPEVLHLFGERAS